MGLQSRPQLPVRFLGLVTKNTLSEMLAQTYAEAKNVDPNEAYQRLEVALKSDLRLIEGLQSATWRALVQKKPSLDDKALTEHVAKRLEKARRFQALKPKRADQGPLAALMVLIDQACGYSTGEAASLLYSPQGEQLLAKGFELAGNHLAHEMTR
ncbi:hypothetical protein L6R52_32275 [Myxococcota bacterium]|nr:hypothetical protein [Myxococcota bacterium]